MATPHRQPDDGRDADRDEDHLGVLDDQGDDVRPTLGEVINEVHGTFRELGGVTRAASAGAQRDRLSADGAGQGPGEEVVEQCHHPLERRMVIEHPLGVA